MRKGFQNWDFEALKEVSAKAGRAPRRVLCPCCRGTGEMPRNAALTKPLLMLLEIARRVAD